MDELKLPYSITYSPATPHAAKSWCVYGKGFGLRTFPSKQRAVEEAEAYFGKTPLARVTISIYADETRCHIAAAKGAIPSDIIGRALATIEAEAEELSRCPVHRAIISDPAARP